ncbi:MAG: hypothetical protein MUE41_05685 [Gemmatimonadaceae bacterium]|jgi:hypothetical protein|nr:hypothetical protein [Gemmatimonadaceae bacterium]
MLDEAPILHVSLGPLAIGDHVGTVSWPLGAGAEIVHVEDDVLRVRRPGKKKLGAYKASLRADGLLSVEAGALRFEYRLHGALDGTDFTSDPRVAEIPLALIRAMRVERRRFFLRRLVIEPRTLSAFTALPHRISGDLVLPLRRGERAVANALITEARYRAAQLAIGDSLG